MIAQHISRLCILVFGTLYPAYSSYKAIKNKDIKEYSRWMMYWIVFAIFSFFEVFADIFIGIWLPFYYEAKILFVLWLMSPYGNGARIMYKHLVHPELNKREEIIDSYITTAKELGVLSVWHLWRKLAEFANKSLIYFFQTAHTAIYYQIQRNHITAAAPVPPQLSQPNLLQQIMLMGSQNENRLFLNNEQAIHAMGTDSPLISQNLINQRWLSEQTLNIVELDETFPSTSGLNLRSESETNLDDWEKMDVQEIDSKPPIKGSKSKIKRTKIVKKGNTSTDLSTPSGPLRRTTRVAAVKARAKCKEEPVDDLDEDF